jgi:2-polyprenyl-3-methyl-5-hydroxy-6-metoxy-1,4-benzoquinol methylase
MMKIPFIPYPIAGGKASCPLCGSDEAENLSRWDRRLKPLQPVKSANCSLIRQSYMPSDTELSAYYRTSYRKDYQNAHRGPSVRHIAKRQAEAAPRLTRLAAHLPPGARIADFGCGSGEFIAAAAARGFDAIGFEPGADYARHAKSTLGLSVQNCGWQDFVPPSGAMDAVTAFHVFEHLTDPLAALQQVKSWLSPNGIAYIEVPNMAVHLKKGFGSLHLAHTIGFSRYSLELLGAAAGMAVVETVDGTDIGMMFRNGSPRATDDIMEDAHRELEHWTQSRVHRQYWIYTCQKLVGRRPADLRKRHLRNQ